MAVLADQVCLSLQALPGRLLPCLFCFHLTFHSALFLKSLWHSYFFPLLSPPLSLADSSPSMALTSPLLQAPKPVHLLRSKSPQTHPPLSGGLGYSHLQISPHRLHITHRQRRFLPSLYNPHSRIYPAELKTAPTIIC